MTTDKKELILFTALKLFTRYGIQYLTMDDIANHCGISKKTIYKHFQNKTDLINQIIEIKISTHVEDLKNIRSNSKNAIIELNLFFKSFYEIIAPLSPTLIKELRKDNVLILLKFNKIKNTIILPFIQNNLIRGKNELLYKPDINIEEISFSTNTLITLIVTEKFSTQTKSLDSLMSFLKTLLIHRLVTTNGLKYI